MSTSMNVLLRGVKDATECPICTEIFSSPKMLPCFHTFCLKCIEQYGKDTPVGDTLTCPLCRGEFKVPVGGLSKLKSNFCLERLAATVESVPRVAKYVDCDVCIIKNKCKKAATSFCAECQQSMCNQCFNMHGSKTATMTHHPSPLGDVLPREAKKKTLRKYFCETHPKKEIEFFCQGCRVSVCGACSMTKHNKHDIRDIAEIAEESKERFKMYSDDASNLMTNIKARSEKISEQFDSFTNSIEQVKTTITRRDEDIKRMVEKQTSSLLGELDGHKALVSKTVESTKEDLQRDLLICDSFNQYCTKIVAEADHVETVSVAEELATRAAKLNVMTIPDLEICPQLQFIPPNLDITLNQGSIVGGLSAKLPTPGYVRGITSWKTELYVVTYKSPDINVYDIDTLAHRRKIRVEGLVDAWDIVAHANVLYVSENRDKLIHRIQLSDETSSNWSVNSGLLTMSINKKGNVVVSCIDLKKVIEYTPTGSYVREIQVNKIDGTNIGVHHAIQLNDDQFLLCHSTTTTEHHRVSMIDSNGRMIKSYGGEAGSGMGQMNWPCYLAIDRNGFIVVADCDNNRIIQLNAFLEFTRELILGSAGLKKPRRMHLHEEKRRLYIAESAERNITIFDL